MEYLDSPCLVFAWSLCPFSLKCNAANCALNYKLTTVYYNGTNLPSKHAFIREGNWFWCKTNNNAMKCLHMWCLVAGGHFTDVIAEFGIIVRRSVTFSLALVSKWNTLICTHVLLFKVLTSFKPFLFFLLSSTQLLMGTFPYDTSVCVFVMNMVIDR